MNPEKIIENIVNYFTDKSKGVFNRFATFLFFVTIIFIIDDYFKFSYNFKVNSQIEQISKIESIVKDTKDSTLVIELKSIEKIIIDKRSTYGFFSSLYDSINRQSENAARNISTNPIIHYLSSNLALIIAIILMFRKLKKWIVTKVIWFIMVAGIIIGLFFWLSGLITGFFIPETTSLPLKIILNILFQMVFFSIFYFWFYIQNKQNDKRQNEIKETTSETTTNKVKENSIIDIINKISKYAEEKKKKVESDKKLTESESKDTPSV